MESVKVKIPYGDSFLHISIPKRNLMKIIAPKKQSPLKSLDNSIKLALDRPFGGKSFSDTFAAGDSVAVLVDDYTRPTPIDRILPIVLNKLNKTGVRDEDITVVVALGNKPPMSKKRLTKKIGEASLQRVKVVQHDCDAQKDMVFMGITNLGTPLFVNKAVALANKKMGIGNIVPTPWAGFGGGAKILFMTCGRMTIEKNHTMMFSPKVTWGNLNNPVRQDMENAARIVGFDMILNTILNSKREVVRVVAGDPVQAHREGVKTAKKLYRVAIPTKADVTVIAPGSPYDLDLHRATHFSLLTADRLTKKNGDIILVSACPRGIEFRNRLDQFECMKLSPKDLFSRLWKKEAPLLMGALPGYKLHRTFMEKRVIIISDLAEKDVKRLGFCYAESTSAALNISMKRHGNNAKIAVVLQGAMVWPDLEG